MLQPRITPPMARLLLNPTVSTRLLRRQPPSAPLRAFTTTPLLRATPKPLPHKPQPAQPQQPPKDGADPEVFVPRPLGRPIGFSHAPLPGQNTGPEPKKKRDYTGMTMSQRNLAKREELVEKWGTNYFRDFKNIRKYRSGKTFMANARIFKKDAALYFPNFRGDTLAGKGRDTTDVLKGKVSVVNVFSSEWGAMQVQTFSGKAANPGLHEVLAQNEGVAQVVDVNIEENTLKAWIISLFQWNLRLKKRREDWGRYFVVRKGVSERIRETIGLLNGRVGYVYLVDQDCKIRWAGSADAEGTEIEDLTKGFARLIDEAKAGPPKLKGKPPGGQADAGAVEDKSLPIPLPIAF